MKPIEHDLPVNVNQILSWVRQCSETERKLILTELLRSDRAILLASEKSLAKDWLSREEDEAWKGL